MDNIKEGRRVGRPHNTVVGIAERMKRYEIAEKCGKFTDGSLNFGVRCLKTRPLRSLCD